MIATRIPPSSPPAGEDRPLAAAATAPSIRDLPQEAAAEAGLRYTSDTKPGIRRRRAGRGFSYIDRYGAPIHDQRQLQRIRSLAIPPAWRDVWICPSANGHLQATGRDARGRKQYRYHPKWRAIRDGTKYARLIRFGEALPMLRERLEADSAFIPCPESALSPRSFVCLMKHLSGWAMRSMPAKITRLV